jgi:hypothetical protein
MNTTLEAEVQWSVTGNRKAKSGMGPLTLSAHCKQRNKLLVVMSEMPVAVFFSPFESFHSHLGVVVGALSFLVS